MNTTTRTPERLSFAGFQASGRATDDLRVTCPEQFDPRDYTEEMPGRVYGTEGNAIAYMTRNSEFAGKWDVEIGNFLVTAELARAETELYGWYVTEMADDDVRAYLMDAAPDCSYWPVAKRGPYSEGSLCELLRAFCTFHGLPQASADDLLTFDHLTLEQAAWLRGFGERWDVVMAAQEAARISDTESSLYRHIAVEQEAMAAALAGKPVQAPLLPTNIPFKPAFLSTFEHVLDTGYNALRTDPEGLSGSELREQLDNAIGETLACLVISEPKGGSLEWLAQLHDWINEAYGEISAALDATTDADDSFVPDDGPRDATPQEERSQLGIG